jgi:transposase, IS5 family
VRPHSQNIPKTIDLFRSQLDQIINMEHELVLLAHAVDWDYLNEKNSDFYRDEG